MHEIHQFGYGITTPLIAYLVAVIGSASGLSAASRARVPAPWPVRSGWLVLAAVSIGGVGVWVAHFVGLLGFTVTGMAIGYDVPMTIASAVVGIVVLAIGLHLVVLLGSRPAVLLGGGIVGGLGVAAMHYLGVAALRVNGELHHDVTFVGLTAVVAVVAVTAALWLCARTRGLWATLGAALALGAAVTGVHVAGMAGISATGAGGDAPDGVAGWDLLGPVIIFGGVTVLLLIVLVMAAPTEDELHEDAAWERRRRRVRVGS